MKKALLKHRSLEILYLFSRKSPDVIYIQSSHENKFICKLLPWNEQTQYRRGPKVLISLKNEAWKHKTFEFRIVKFSAKVKAPVNEHEFFWSTNCTSVFEVLFVLEVATLHKLFQNIELTNAQQFWIHLLV